MKKKIRVVIADDSALMRKKLSDILNGDPGIEVTAVAHNGKQALEAVHALKPDVVTLDVEMAVMDGLDTLGYIMSEIPTPCVMISAFTKQGAAETIKALEFGAIDFIAKPGCVISPNIDEIALQIIHMVKTSAGIPVRKLKLFWAKKANDSRPVMKKPSTPSRVFAIASSTGGTQALASIIPKLRGDFPAALLVVQHMPGGFTRSLAERLGWQSQISVVEAEDRMPVKPAQVIIARGGLHMEVSGDAKTACINLTDRPSRLGLRPCADIMMESAAKIFKNRVVGVVLTGMGSDGTAGSREIKSKGGMIFTEHKTSCVIYGMPRSVVEAGLSDKVVTLRKMADEMEALV